MDILCDTEESSSLITAVLLEMVEHQSADVIVHAFNILFNLGVHANLAEELQPGIPSLRQ